MIGITIETHTTKAIANEVGAGGSAGPPPRPRDLSSVVVVPDAALLQRAGLDERGERHVICGHGHKYCGVSRAGWRRRGWVAAQRLGFGSAGGGVTRRTWVGRVGVSVVPRFVEHQRAKGPVPARRHRLSGQKDRLQKKDRLQG